MTKKHCFDKFIVDQCDIKNSKISFERVSFVKKTITILALHILFLSSHSYAQYNFKHTQKNLGISDQAGFEASIEKYKDSIKIDPAKYEYYYNIACCYSNIGNTHEAFRFLDVSIKKGFKDVIELKLNDDFIPLHNLKEWKEIVDLCIINEVSEYKVKGGNIELFEIYLEDQLDRVDPNMGFEIVYKDSVRRQKVKKIMSQNLLKIPEDYFHAGMIFQHHWDSTSLLTAHELASKAMLMDSSNKDNRWLFAATKDRYLQSIKKPQIYGTQFHADGYGCAVLGKFDTLAIKDDVRIWMTKKSLRQLLEYLDEINRDFLTKLNKGQISLYHMYKDDQEARRHFESVMVFMYDPIEFVDTNDKMRLESVKNLIKKDSLHTAEDYFFSAMILYHGGGNIDTANYRLADQFSNKAIDMDLYFTFEYIAKWLAAASYDRYLLYSGKPQQYGTQYTKNKNDCIELAKFDEKAKSDDERSRYRIFPLAYLKKLIDEYNTKNCKNSKFRFHGLEF